MSVLETAIRNALARSDRADAEVRAKVYGSARAALDNGLLKQGVVDTAVISAQRDRLESLINRIEAEEQEAVLAYAESMRKPNLANAASEASQISVSPDVEVSRRDATNMNGRHDPSLMDAIPMRRGRGQDDSLRPATKTFNKGKQSSVGQVSDSDVQPEKRVRRSRARSSMFTRIFVIGILLAFAIGAAIWVKESGLWALIQQHGFDVENTDVVEDSNATPLIKNPLDPRRSFDSSWVEIFTGSDIAALETKGDASVEPAKAADGAYALITSASAGKSGEVTIPVSSDILAQMSGKTSTIALTIGSGGDTSSQLSAECNFGPRGGCGRHRFTVTSERGDFLFKVKVPSGVGSSSSGMIILNSDVSGNGKSVKLFAIRVLPAEE